MNDTPICPTSTVVNNGPPTAETPSELEADRYYLPGMIRLALDRLESAATAALRAVRAVGAAKAAADEVKDRAVPASSMRLATPSPTQHTRSRTLKATSNRSSRSARPRTTGPSTLATSGAMAKTTKTIRSADILLSVRRRRTVPSTDSSPRSERIGCSARSIG